MRLVLYQPEIPQNTGALMRLAACLGVALDIIEPCGFVFDDRRLRRVAMDYLDGLDWTRWPSWTGYSASAPAGRLIVLTAAGETAHTGFSYRPGDRLMLGRESVGIPEEIAELATARVAVRLKPGARSLNVVVAAAMVLGEALRQAGEL